LYAVFELNILEALFSESFRKRVPTPLGKSWKFFLKFSGPGKSRKLKFRVLESPGIYVSFNVTNMVPTPLGKSWKFS